MKIMSKKVLTAVLCAATLSSTFLFTGCNLSNVAKGVQQGVQRGKNKILRSLTNTLRRLEPLMVT